MELFDRADDSNGNSICPSRDVGFHFAEWIQQAGLVLFCFSCVYYPVTILWWVRRRNHQMLVHRNFWLMVVSAFGGLIDIFLFAFVNYLGRRNVPCDLTMILSFIAVPLLMGPISIRILLFNNNARYRKLLLNIKESKGVWEMHKSKKESKSVMVRAWLHYNFISCCGRRRRASKLFDKNKIQDDEEKDSNQKNNVSMRKLSRSSSEQHEKKLALQLGTTSIFMFFMMVVFLLGSGFIILSKFLEPNSPYGFLGCYGCHLSSTDIYTFLVIVVFVLFFGVAMLVRNRKLEDPLGLQRELRVLLLFLLPVILSASIAIIDPAELRKKGEIEFLYLTVIGILAIHTVQCPYQIYRTYRFDKQNKKAMNDSNFEDENISFEEVWNDIAKRRVFGRYLATEFSLENLVFCESIELFKQNYKQLSTEECLKDATEICETFFNRGSMLEVNISASARNAVEEILKNNTQNEKPPVDIFSDPYEEIKKLMFTDSFVRFIKSKYFKALKDGAYTEKEIDNLELGNSTMGATGSTNSTFSFTKPGTDDNDEDDDEDDSDNDDDDDFDEPNNESDVDDDFDEPSKNSDENENSNDHEDNEKHE